MSKSKLTVSLPTDVVARVRATVAGVQRQQDPSFTLTQMVADALEAHVKRLEDEHHDGQPWPSTKRLRAGRPLGE